LSFDNPQVEKHTKKFYFQEIEKIIEFPNPTNPGKYNQYYVELKTAETVKKLGKAALLGEFLESPEVENNYPHTVGYYKESTGEGPNFKPEYLAIRKICTIEEFWLFLNASNI